MALFGPTKVEKLKDRRDFKGLAKALFSGDENQRGEAVDAVAQLGSTDAVAAIVEASSKGDVSGIEAAARALVGLDQLAATSLIDLALSGPSPTSVDAIALLGWMGDPLGLSSLRTLLQRSPEGTQGDVTVRTFTALALGKVGTPDSLAVVISLLGDSTVPVRLGAATALEEHRDPRAAEPLRRAAEDRDPSVREQAQKSLSALERP